MTAFVPNQQLFEHNLHLLAEHNSLLAYQIGLVKTDQVHFCFTDKKELNLYKKRYGITDYYHSQTGALAEAQVMIREEVLQSNQVIYVYGLGLAYLYEVLKPWLKENPQRQLIFLEDDLEVFAHFFYTERASEVLRDLQVTLFQFEDIELDQLNFYKLHSRFINLNVYFLALPYYAQRRLEQSFTLCYRVLYDQSLMTATYNEYLSGQKGYFSHFYRNMLRLPNHYLATGLFGKFKNIPAIICGAGPSLEKNIETLKTLKDKALIFGGGSSLNVLNAYGITPHFGVGIDPNPEQYHRLLTNHTFHIPFFYRPRMTYEALEMVHGPKLYVPGSLQALPTWFEEKFNIESPKIDEGHNVVNFCTEIAQYMGCNPIIYVGMDLAFTEIKTYAAGIPTHPIWLGYSDPYIHEKEKQVLLLKDIYGESIKTKWDWVLEADWLSHYAISHPSIQMINATEGGLGFPSVPNQTLAEVAQKHLKASYDLQNWIHMEVQNSRLQIDPPKILNLLIEFKKSLENCIDYCSKLANEQITDAGSSSPSSTKRILTEGLLQEETGYRYFLEFFEKAYIYLEEAHAITKSLPEDKRPFTPEKRYTFLTSVLKLNLDLLVQAVQQFIFSGPPLALTSTQPSRPLKSPSSEELYSFEKNRLIIQDPEFNLHFDESFHPVSSETLTSSYPNGSIKMQSFYKQGQLHGPSRFYSKKGTLLAEGWFIRGERQGKNKLFYPSGRCYAIQRYVNDHLEGLQEYFHENGQLHIIFSYKNGIMEGEVLIYSREGVLVRQLTYQQGQRHGYERMWNQQGILLMECEYQNGTPIGKALQYGFEGHLQRQTIIHHFPEDYDLTVWNAQGEVKQTIIHGVEDYSSYYSDAQEKIEVIDKTIKLIMGHVDPLFHNYIINEEAMHTDPTMAETIKEIREEVQRLQKTKDDLIQMIKENLEQAKEGRDKIQFPDKHE
jgi:antitoxin component YwqK of YwqJK toxin-antitoxin module